jgi:hypothetical protein
MATTLTFSRFDARFGKRRAAPQRRRHRRRLAQGAGAAAIGAAVVLAIAFAGGVRHSADAPGSTRAAPMRGAAPIVGTFTGRDADGLPIYRLPPIEVVARRD